jgi:hypothetical protein
MIAVDQILKGVARAFDIGAVLSSYEQNPDSKQADFEALRSDWERVEQDLYTVIATYEQQ